MQTTKSYDFIFLGSGCATLSLLVRMASTGKFSAKKILLLDRELKNKNDRTWCFWETGPNYFEPIVHKRWSELRFKSAEETIKLDIHPYQYKMIRGIDFYNYCFEKIKALDIEYQYGELSFSTDEAYKIFFNGEALNTNGAVVFNTIYQPEKSIGSINILQHFKGWIVETKEEAFEENVGTLMDFSINQKFGTSFVYTLPLSSRKALIEYTLFTATLLKQNEYLQELKFYVENNLGIKSYKILEDEFGIIPMSNNKFKYHNSGVYNLGTAGGQTKASTGYTFQFIQKQSDQILKSLLGTGNPKEIKEVSPRFRFYDNTFLDVLANNNKGGNKLFEILFKKNKASKVFKFLDNETNLSEELKIISSLPILAFSKSGIKNMFG